MPIKQILFVLVLLLMPLPFLSAQGVLFITELPERKTTKPMESNRAEAVFLSDFPYLSIKAKSVDQIESPQKNEQGLYEYHVILDLSNEDYYRIFSVDIHTVHKGKIEDKIVFAEGDVKYFIISEKIDLKPRDVTSYLPRGEKDQACVELSMQLQGLQINAHPLLQCKCEETPDGNTHSIFINTRFLDSLKKTMPKKEWKKVSTLKFFFHNSDTVSLSIDGIKHHDKQRYTIDIKEKENVNYITTFFTLNGSYSFMPFWSYGFKIGQIYDNKKVGWYVAGMSNLSFKGSFRPFNEGEQYDLTGRSKSTRISALVGIVLRPVKPIAFHVGAGFGYFAQTFEIQNGKWRSFPKRTYLGVDVALGMAFHIKKFMLSVEAVSTNFKTIELKTGIGFALSRESKRIRKK